jgi:hypothetical protein
MTSASADIPMGVLLQGLIARSHEELKGLPPAEIMRLITESLKKSDGKGPNENES